MNNRKLFFELSRELGGNPIYAQGAGGNTSAKEGEAMLVKASGFAMKDANEKRGYVACSYEPVRSYLRGLNRDTFNIADDAAFNAFIASNLLSSFPLGIPSIETGMHAVLGAYVFHTHNVYANVLACTQGGEKIIGKLFGSDAAWIPYANPGLPLASRIYRQTKISNPPIYFLQNHGMITQGASPEDAAQRTRAVTETIKAYLAERGALTPFVVQELPLALDRHLFPDSIVYAQINISALPDEKRRALFEINSAVRYITETIARLGATPTFIPDADVTFVKNMEKEKHRIALANR